MRVGRGKGREGRGATLDPGSLRQSWRRRSTFQNPRRLRYNWGGEGDGKEGRRCVGRGATWDPGF